MKFDGFSATMADCPIFRGGSAILGASACSLKAGLGSADFARIRIGVGRPPTTDPDRVAAYVLGRFREPKPDVQDLIERAADAVENALTPGEPDAETQS